VEEEEEEEEKIQFPTTKMETCRGVNLSIIGVSKCKSRALESVPLIIDS